MYRLSKDQYNMLLNNSITSIYKEEQHQEENQHQREKHFERQGSATTHEH